MLLRYRATLLILAIAGVACTDPSEPSTLSATFNLTDVDGQSLPATAPGVTIISGSMSLDQLGNAIITEDRTDQSGGSTAIRYNYLYRINNANIEFTELSPCPTNSICTMPPTGEIVDNTIRVKLTFQTMSPFQVYNYRSFSRF